MENSGRWGKIDRYYPSREYDEQLNSPRNKIFEFSFQRIQLKLWVEYLRMNSTREMKPDAELFHAQLYRSELQQ